MTETVKDSIRLEIVSAEEAVFSGDVKAVYVTGQEGEIGVAPGHAPLLTMLKPGVVRADLGDNEEKVFYISGGMVEVQPFVVTVLADTAARASDLDEAAAQAARKRAEQAFKDRKGDFDYSKSEAELANAIAQIRAIRIARNLKSRA